MNSTARQAILTWFSTATGLTTLWADQDTPRPDYPYATLDVVSTRKIGQDEITWAYDEEGEAGTDMVATITGIRHHTLSCQVLSAAEEFSGSAEEKINLAANSLQYPSVLAALRVAKVAYIRTINITDRKTLAGGHWLSRWGIDVEFSTLDSVTPVSEKTSYIKTIEVDASFNGSQSEGAFDWDDETFGG